MIYRLACIGETIRKRAEKEPRVQLKQTQPQNDTVGTCPKALIFVVQDASNAAGTAIPRNKEAGSRKTPRDGLWGSHNGFSYIGVLMTVAIVGIAMSAANRYWSTVIQREREAELLFRGHQIKTAIGSYYENPPAGQSSQYPRTIVDLLRDPRYPQTRRHLRKWYPDPLTGHADWVVIRDTGGRIKGVYSRHEGRPLKSGNFPKEYDSFEGAASFADWQFVYTPQAN